MKKKIMLYNKIKNYIDLYLKEEFHTSSKGSLPYNNSLNQTLDNGNINYETLISKYYNIDEHYDYDSFETQRLSIKLKNNYTDLFRKLNLNTNSYNYESSDIETFNMNKRRII